MTKNVKIASFSLNPIPYKEIPKDKSVLQAEIEWLEKNVAQVLADKPDLIVLPECCDRPDGMPLDKLHEYYAERGNKYLARVQKLAKENHCYIAFGAHRFLEDGTGYNSCYMIGRKGEIVGIYDKNHIVPAETSNNNIYCGERESIFECDFGKVGAVICFDLNFEEIRQKYKRVQPKLMVFPSNFGGGLMRNFFAFDTHAYFVSSCGYDCPAEILSPLGVSLGSTSNHYNYVIRTVNLDYEIVHLDGHWDKIRAIKERYGALVEVTDVGYIGVVMLTYHGEGKTMADILQEFDARTAEDYFDEARAHREKFTK